ncbi:MAG: hypothetical protein OK452_04315 [Thaumarchaeota archaeon]|nr:hypothetical protein [Nitrososphaerota archaeon]
MNWVRFGLTATYGLIVFLFFFLYLTNFIATADISKDILYVGFVIMIGIVLSMAANTSESRSKPN